jgi:hypothetical protein
MIGLLLWVLLVVTITVLSVAIVVERTSDVTG